jgi:hypothetical protein
LRRCGSAGMIVVALLSERFVLGRATETDAKAGASPHNQSLQRSA